MELINGNSEPVKEFFQSLECLLDGINRLAKENKPSLGGDSFLSNREGYHPLYSDTGKGYLPPKRYRQTSAIML